MAKGELSFPGLEAGFPAYGRLTGDSMDPQWFEDAVIKAVPQGLASWSLPWGPGPDPRDVVAEALIAEDGTFTLTLPYPLVDGL